MSQNITSAYKRIIVLTFGGAAAALLLFLIFQNAMTDYELSAFTFSILAQIILTTLALDLFALNEQTGGRGQGGGGGES